MNQDLRNFYLCGGAVRDRFLGRKIKDHDFVVLVDSFDAMREEIIKNNGTIFLESPKYLTIRGTLPGYGAADFVLPRTDGEYKDGRRPMETTIANNLYLDSCRRDFSINAMYQNLATGEILDFHDGQADLADGRIRCVGKTTDRFTEDKLRIMRAIRQKLILGFKLDRDIHYYLEDFPVSNDGNEILKGVSEERIYDELTKMMRFDWVETMELIFKKYHKIGHYIKTNTKIWLKPTMEEK